MIYKTTQKHFQIYQAECLRCLRNWSLLDYTPYFEHVPLDECYAATRWNQRGHTVLFQLNTEWDRKPTPNEIKKSARHECLHGLTARLRDLALARFTSEEAVMEADEALVVTLENIGLAGEATKGAKP